ncbi:MAG: hypothetical protein AB1758_23595 [Candidatus Eremiobacterota bacterium]
MSRQQVGRIERLVAPLTLDSLSATLPLPEIYEAYWGCSISCRERSTIELDRETDVGRIVDVMELVAVR